VYVCMYVCACMYVRTYVRARMYVCMCVSTANEHETGVRIIVTDPL